jgi:predicted TIM-barrel fold metal-dependent hydrolase
MVDDSELHSACFETSLVDTHEHLLSPSELYQQVPDFLWTLEEVYVHCDLLSAGLDVAAKNETLSNTRKPLNERIAKWWPAWRGMRNTGYARMLEIACRDLFEVSEISPETVEVINTRLAESRKPGWLEHCLSQARIEMVVRDAFRFEYIDDYPPLFRFALRIDDFTRNCLSRHALYPLEERTGVAINSLEDMVDAMRRYVDQALATGKVATFKLADGYFRPVAIGKRNRAEAERCFERLVHQSPEGAMGDPCADRGADSQTTISELRPLHDYLYHHIFTWADEIGLPVQIHVGMFEGSGNFFQRSHPVDLIPIFLRYPRVRFDLFHAAYPYWRELGVIAKNLPNVFPNLCWTHIISPIGARRALDEWLDVVPANKILAFGGDVTTPERAYSHAIMARENVFRVLRRRMTEEGWKDSRAAEVARMLLRENALALYQIKPGLSSMASGRTADRRAGLASPPA